jgi:beta-glucosidase
VPPEAAGKFPLFVEWSGFLTPPETGDFNLGVRAEGSIASVSVDGKPVAQEFTMNAKGPQAKIGRVHFEQGKKVAIKVRYGTSQPGPMAAQLIWSKYDRTPSPEAVAAARNADIVVAVVGITSELEGEEMPVSEEGFKGGDRTSLDLPKPEQNLLEAVATAGKPLVVVLMNGSALSVNWANEHANAILEAWYSGEEGGAGIAETLSGKNNPGGRLPVTFYKDVSQLPPFEDYAMKGRTYRYFEGTPLYPFGYGLSYTQFAYSNLKLPPTPVRAGDPLHATVTVKNAGKVGGDEVVQLYLSFPNVEGAPLKALRGFERVHLDPGKSQTVDFNLGPRDLSMVSENGDPIIAAGKYNVSIGGAQPGAGTKTVSGSFSIAGEMKLPE